VTIRRRCPRPCRRRNNPARGRRSNSKTEVPRPTTCSATWAVLPAGLPRRANCPLQPPVRHNGSPARQSLDPTRPSGTLLKNPAQCCDLNRQIAVLDRAPRPPGLNQRIFGNRFSRTLQKHPKQRDSTLAEDGRFGTAKQYLGVRVETVRAKCVNRRHRLSGAHWEIICNYFGLISRPSAAAGSSCGARKLVKRTEVRQASEQRSSRRPLPERSP
jgi:hypothetical protein